MNGFPEMLLTDQCIEIVLLPEGPAPAYVSTLAYQSASCAGACFYQATFQVDAPADMFVDARSLGKGEVFINGQPLGRFWKIGPQGTLYPPAPWLKKGNNEIVVFDLDGQGNPSLPFLAHAILDANSELTRRYTSNESCAANSGGTAFGSEASS